MKSSLLLRVAVWVAVLAGAFRSARAEETLEEVKAHLEKMWEPWKGCEQGTWVQVRYVTKNGAQETVMEFRQTLVARDEKEMKIETRSVKRSTDADGKEVVELGEPQNAVSNLSGPTNGYEDLKDVRHEDVQVSGKTISCRVVKATYVTKLPVAAPNGQTEFRTKMTLWISPDVQGMGGLVKSETDSEKQGTLPRFSTDMTLVETAKELKIGSRTVRCNVYRYGSFTGNEETASTGELWLSPDVPYGYAKMISEMNYSDGTKSHVTTEMEITGMEIVKLKKE